MEIHVNDPFFVCLLVVASLEIYGEHLWNFNQHRYSQAAVTIIKSPFVKRQHRYYD